MALPETKNKARKLGLTGVAMITAVMAAMLAAAILSPISEPTVVEAQFSSGSPTNLARTPIGFSSLDPGVLQQVTPTITAAQIKALNSTPITLVSAPGTGKFIELVSCVSEFQFVSTQYTGSYSIVIQLNSVTVGTITSSLSMNAFVANQMLTAQATGIVTNTLPSSTSLNAALTLFASTGNPASGDGTLLLHVQYRVHSGF